MHCIDVAHSVFCLFVCWSKRRAVQKRLNRSRCRLDGWFWSGAVYHVLDRSRDPSHGNGQFLGSSLVHWKALGACAAMYSAKGIIQSPIKAWHRDCCSRLQCSRLVGVTLHCSRPSAMRPFVKNSLSTCYYYYYLAASHAHNVARSVAEPICLPFGGWILWIKGTMY